CPKDRRRLCHPRRRRLRSCWRLHRGTGSRSCRRRHEPASLPPRKESPMAFSEALAQRIRQRLARRKKNIEEKKMFGCICFFLNGNALAGVWKDGLIARLGPDEGEAALKEPHV